MSVTHGTPGRVGTVSSVLDAIGDTPLLYLDGIWVKLEFLNPSGSIKARIARYIIERAEREGLLKPGDIIVEASSGSTAVSEAYFARFLGLPFIAVMPASTRSPNSWALSPCG